MDDRNNLCLVRHDASELAVRISLSPLSVDGNHWSVVQIRDDRVRRASQEEEARTALRFRVAFEENMAPMVFTNLQDEVIAVNDAFCQMLGFSSDEVLGHDSSAYTHPDDVGVSPLALRNVVAEPTREMRYVKRYVHKDGRIITVEISRSAACDAEGNTAYFVISERDITESVERNRLLILLNHINRLATYAVEEGEFLQQVCTAMVEEGGYALAWFGVTSRDDEDGIDVMCAAGDTEYLAGRLDDWWVSKDGQLGPTMMSMRSGSSQIVNNFAFSATSKVWGERAAQFGFGSMAAIPDHIGDRRAALIVYHRDSFAFDNVIVDGLEEIVRESELAIIQIRSDVRIAHSLEESIIANEDLKRSALALSVSEQRFRLSFEGNMSPMVFSDDGDLAIAVNDAFCELVGYTREEILGHDSSQFTLPEDVGITERMHFRFVSDEIDHARYVKRYLTKDQRIVVAEVSRSTARDENGTALYYFSSERDVTEERALGAQLAHQALHDTLTGLPNRALFEDRLAQAQARILRQGGWGAVMLLDLDDFKGVNDTHGHMVGDELLVAVARRLEFETRAGDTLCHLTGDEFLYLAEGFLSAGEAEDVAKRLLSTLRPPFVISGIQLEQRASVGVVVWDATITESSDMVQSADAALREAKGLNRGNFTLFAAGMNERAVKRFTLIQELRQAFQVGEISMYYQPIVDLATSSTVGFEALMRWRHPQRGFVSPEEFIPLAEESHFIIELGAFALREAVAAARSWADITQPHVGPYVTVNLSTHQFYDPGLVAMIEATLDASGLAADRLIVEITESAALVNVDTSLRVIEGLRSIGVAVALDDFGTGYSSLSYLTRLQPRIIKIDKSFVSPSQESEQNDMLLEMIVGLGHNLKMTMLAEGIETTAQLERLRTLSCELGQGYLFSPAVPVDQSTRMVGGVFPQSER